ncbi:MAG: hypothetical protein HPY69_04145 [Armatimonadetes bacterium]|nr:hypothetical protein [Armatimonadota bacterium]
MGHMHYELVCPAAQRHLAPVDAGLGLDQGDWSAVHERRQPRCRVWLSAGGPDGQDQHGLA